MYSAMGSMGWSAGKRIQAVRRVSFQGRRATALRPENGNLADS